MVQDELDPSVDYGSRHRIMDEYIVYVKKTCKSEMCLNGELSDWAAHRQ